MRQGYSFLPLLFKIVPEVLSNPIREEKEVKGIQFGEEETKLCSQVAWYLYKKSKRTDEKSLLELISGNSKVTGYKIKVQKELYISAMNK